MAEHTRGMTVLENVFAGFLMTLMFFVIVSLYPTSLLGLRRAHDTVGASNFGLQLMEQARTSAQAQSTPSASTQTYQNAPFTGVVTAAADPLDNKHVEDVTVLVTWTNGTDKASLSYFTHVYLFSNP